MKFNKLLPFASLAVAGVLASATAVAADITIAGNTADRDVYTGAGWPSNVNSQTMRVGTGGLAPNPLERAAVFVFQLPDIDAALITGASFSFDLVGRVGSGWSFDFDLYALSARASADVLASDFYAGAADQRSGVFLIQDDIAGSTTPIGRVVTGNSADSSLTSFIQDQLNNGKAGQYIFLRLNADVAGLTSGGINVASADNADAALRPVLVLQTIPESGTTTLMIGAASIAFAATRYLRRRKA